LGIRRCGSKQFLLVRSTGDLPGQQPGAGAALGVELAQLREVQRRLRFSHCE